MSRDRNRVATINLSVQAQVDHLRTSAIEYYAFRDAALDDKSNRENRPALMESLEKVLGDFLGSISGRLVNVGRRYYVFLVRFFSCSNASGLWCSCYCP